MHHCNYIQCNLGCTTWYHFTLLKRHLVIDRTGKAQVGAQRHSNTEPGPGAVLLLPLPTVPPLQHPGSLQAVHVQH